MTLVLQIVTDFMSRIGTRMTLVLQIVTDFTSRIGTRMTLILQIIKDFKNWNRTRTTGILLNPAGFIIRNRMRISWILLIVPFLVSWISKLIVRSMLLHEEITDKIIKSFYKVYNELGFGFLEKVYENALLIELRNWGLASYKQIPIEVYYQNCIVGSYFADIIVDNKVIIELKAGEGNLIQVHELQLINYLKATRIEVGILLSFGKKPEFKRKIFTNDIKNQS